MAAKAFAEILDEFASMVRLWLNMRLAKGASARPSFEKGLSAAVGMIELA
jgi:hypothetical protein